jgi:hypothetical protein
MELESSSPYPQVSATCPYPELTPSSLHDPFQLPEDPSYYYLSIYVLVSLMSFLRLRDTSSRNASPRRSECGSILFPDCFVSRGSISILVFISILFLRIVVVGTSPNPQAEGPPLVGCPRLLVQFIHSYPPNRRPFLHPQPEDAPCRGDRDLHSWPRPLFTPGKDSVSIVQEAGWAPGTVWTFAESFAPHWGFDPRTFHPVASRYNG